MKKTIHIVGTRPGMRRFFPRECPIQGIHLDKQDAECIDVKSESSPFHSTHPSKKMDISELCHLKK